MRFRRHNGLHEPVVLQMSYAECGRLLGLLDTAADVGIDRTGLAARIQFAYDASDLGTIDRDRLAGSPCGTGPCGTGTCGTGVPPVG